MDQIELRRRNALQAGFQNSQGAQPLGELNHLEMLDHAAKHPLWVNRQRLFHRFRHTSGGEISV